jgi:hypothetical protein
VSITSYANLAHPPRAKFFPDAGMVRHIYETAIHCQQFVPMIAQVVDLVIKAPSHDLIKFQECFWRQLSPRLTEITLCHSSDTQGLVLRFPEETVHTPF